MTEKADLWVVKESDSPPKPPKPKTVAEAAASGKPRDLLVAMRERIATAVSAADCPPRELAALTRRLQEIVKDIAALDAIEAEPSSSHGAVDSSFDASAI